MTTYMQQNFTVDDNCALKAAGLIAASAAVATILDLGDAYAEGNIVIDVSAIEVATDEIYDIVAQLSPDAAFGTVGNIVERCSLTLCHSSVTRTNGETTGAVGRYVLPFDNCYKETIYRYLRLYTVVAGTVATGINYSARLAKRLG